jgi:hypothetical protein
MTVPSIVQSDYAAGRGNQRDVILFVLKNGERYGFTSNQFPITWNGDTYQPNTLVSIESPRGQSGTAAIPFSIRLPATNGITPGNLDSIQNLAYRAASVTGWTLFLSNATGAIIGSQGRLKGQVRKLTHEYDGETAVLIAQCETINLRMHKSVYRLMSPENQQRVRAGDTSMDGLASSSAYVEKFGRK